MLRTTPIWPRFPDRSWANFEVFLSLILCFLSNVSPRQTQADMSVKILLSTSLWGNGTIDKVPYYLLGKQCIRKIRSSFLTLPKLYLCQMGDLVSEAEVVYYTTLLRRETKYLGKTISILLFVDKLFSKTQFNSCYRCLNVFVAPKISKHTAHMNNNVKCKKE